jgi:hypothetical protein
MPRLQCMPYPKGPYTHLIICAQLLISMHAAANTGLTDVEAISSSAVGGAEGRLRLVSWCAKSGEALEGGGLVQVVALTATSEACLLCRIMACRIKRKILGWWYLP